MKKILLIGNGAREHALAEAFKRSKHDVALFVVGSAKNPGIYKLAEEYLIADTCDLDKIYEFAKKTIIEKAIITHHSVSSTVYNYSNDGSTDC